MLDGPNAVGHASGGSEVHPSMATAHLTWVGSRRTRPK